jgi:hypothetical protein
MGTSRMGRRMGISPSPLVEARESKDCLSPSSWGREYLLFRNSAQSAASPPKKTVARAAPFYATVRAAKQLDPNVA